MFTLYPSGVDYLYDIFLCRITILFLRVNVSIVEHILNFCFIFSSFFLNYAAHHSVNTAGDRGSDDASDISITGSCGVFSSVID